MDASPVVWVHRTMEIAQSGHLCRGCVANTQTSKFKEAWGLCQPRRILGTCQRRFQRAWSRRFGSNGGLCGQPRRLLNEVDDRLTLLSHYRQSSQGI
jgi:hypothetical protein